MDLLAALYHLKIKMKNSWTKWSWWIGILWWIGQCCWMTESFLGKVRLLRGPVIATTATAAVLQPRLRHYPPLSPLPWSSLPLSPTLPTSTSLASTALETSLSSPASTGSVASVTSSPVVLKARGISKTYTQLPQFQQLDLQILQGQCVGLIGGNGQGKSTLLKCLAGQETTDEGSIEMLSSVQQSVLYLPQDIYNMDFYGYELLFQVAEGSSKDQTKLMKALNQYFLADHADHVHSGQHAAVSDEELTAATEIMTEYDGWGLYSDMIDTLEKVNLAKDVLWKPLHQLSGGERKKLSLINVLLQKPKILFLDEPTNHLDIDAIEWLVDMVVQLTRQEESSVLLITHDRYFLDQVSNTSK